MSADFFPIIAARNLERALSFYRDTLGGTVVFEYPGPDGKAAYVGLDLGSGHLGIGEDESVAGGPPPRPISLWFYAEDCDAAVEAMREQGIPIVAEPADQPWGERIARVLDPDGNEVIVAQRVPSSG